MHLSDLLPARLPKGETVNKLLHYPKRASTGTRAPSLSPLRHHTGGKKKNPNRQCFSASQRDYFLLWKKRLRSRRRLFERAEVTAARAEALQLLFAAFSPPRDVPEIPRLRSRFPPRPDKHLRKQKHGHFTGICQVYGAEASPLIGLLTDSH